MTQVSIADYVRHTLEADGANAERVYPAFEENAKKYASDWATSGGYGEDEHRWIIHPQRRNRHDR